MRITKNILIDIGHPAHVHLFKHFIREMHLKGYNTFVLTKEVDSIVQLLNIYGIPYTSLGKKPDSLWAKYLYQLFIILKTILFVRKHKIDTAFGISMTLPVVAAFTGITTYGMDDDDTSATPVFARFINKSDFVLTPDCLKHENRGKNHIAYSSFHELAYLHPNRFVPDASVLEEAGIKQNEVFFVLRFNAFKAHHDAGVKGINLQQKQKLIQMLNVFGKVFITTERQIEPEFEPYRLPVSAEKIHSLLYFATMFVGDSQTMTTEAALLGTPAFKCNSFAGKLSIPNEIENKYQLCFSYLPENFDKMLKNIQDHLEMPGLKDLFAERRNRMLKDKIDLTDFLVHLPEQYPVQETKASDKRLNE